MDFEKLDSKAVDLAITAARQALDDDEDLAWVRKSRLFEAAYLVGLTTGLRSFADDKDIERHVPRALMATSGLRSADDTFPATPTGTKYGHLKGALESLGAESELHKQVLKELEQSLADLDSQWNVAMRRARTLLADIDATVCSGRAWNADRSGGQPEQANRYVQDLGQALRFLSLLETHHELSERIGK